MDKKVIYEPHPVSPQRKAELREQGYTIVDKRFEPVNAAAQGEDGKEAADNAKKAPAAKAKKTPAQEGAATPDAATSAPAGA